MLLVGAERNLRVEIPLARNSLKRDRFAAAAQLTSSVVDRMRLK
jgi:hypothetical protein